MRIGLGANSVSSSNQSQKSSLKISWSKKILYNIGPWLSLSSLLTTVDTSSKLSWPVTTVVWIVLHVLLVPLQTPVQSPDTWLERFGECWRRKLRAWLMCDGLTGMNSWAPSDWQYWFASDLFIQYLAIYNNEYVPDSIKKCQIGSKFGLKLLKKLPKTYKIWPLLQHLAKFGNTACRFELGNWNNRQMTQHCWENLPST